MNKCHTPITWVNDQAPAINDTHLNQYDGELDTLDDRIITLDSTKALQSDLLLAFKDVALNSSTGVITFTLFNNTTKTIDTLLEKIAINFDYDDDPTSPHYQNLIIELEDGSYKYIDMSALITEYEFVNSSTIAWTIGNDGSVSASVIDGSITSTKLDPTFAVTISNAEANGLKSEGWAVGEQNGTPVTSGSPYYQNNAKWYKEQAQAIAGQTLGGLTDVTITTPQNGDLVEYNNGDWENSSRVNENINSLIDVCGSKNKLLNIAASETVNGITFTVNSDKTITVSGLASAEANHFLFTTGIVLPLETGLTYELTGCPQNSGGMHLRVRERTEAWRDNSDDGNGKTIPLAVGSYIQGAVITIDSGTNISTPVVFKPMLRLSSILDDSYVPYGEAKFAARKDLTSIIATGATNTTGATIPDGVCFYLNGVLCRAIADIANNASFTKNTNYVETTVTNEANKGYVLIPADGTKTARQMLDSLYAQIDRSKLSSKSMIRYNNDYFFISYINATSIVCSALFVDYVNSKDITKTMQLLASNSNRYVHDGSFINESNNYVPNGGFVGIYY